MRGVWISWMVVLALALTGCAGLNQHRSFADRSELLATRGEPTRIWENEDGTRTLEYATQPFGQTCWMYTVDEQGNIVEQFDALSRRNLATVRQGMSLDEVQRMLGQHRAVQRFSLSGEEVYDWNVANEWPDLVATRFNVHFIDGIVERTSFTYVYPRDPWRLSFGAAFGHPYPPHWGWAPYWRYPGPWPHHPWYW